MSYVFILVVLFVVIMTGGIIGLLRYQRLRKEKVFSDKILFLKTYGKEIKVDFKSCNIVHREYFDEVEKSRKNISIITFQWNENNGKSVLFKTLPIFLGEEDLRNRIRRKRKTTIYYDPSNPEIYYFDVEFLMTYMILEKV